jgi:hypothetical protein
MGSRLNIFSVTASAGVRPWSSAAVKVSGWESKPRVHDVNFQKWNFALFFVAKYLYV